MAISLATRAGCSEAARVGRGGAPVVADHGGGGLAERLDQRERVAAEGLQSVSRAGIAVGA